ncbi:MAG: S-layer homology domain-containing protein [Candidatus Margulisbacteria bacterium]|nr:S-layer homology domain-containing protein [Candidatus Margulisiibacteriota bacterium]
MKKLIALLILAVFALPAVAQYVAQDPTRYIPNAKILGLGKAYIGLADDIGSIYTNPAGMAKVTGWQLTSMSGKFLDEYSYLSFSGLYPTDYGVIGLGFAGTSISGAWATTVESQSDPDDPIYTIDLSQPQMGNYNNAVILSYANQLQKISYLNQIPQAENISVGANLKLFQVALYGDGIVGGNASGTELDLGLKYFPPQKWMGFGVTVQNLLPMSMGGKLKYASGHEESYPAVFEAGSYINLLGKKDGLRSFGDHELKLAADFDMHPTLKNYPMTWHVGAEWRPITLLALRAGIDQDAAGDGSGGLGVVSDSTYGVGLFFGGFRFDYAYHTFAGAPNVDNHFFSLSYALKPKPEEVIGAPIVITRPPDKLITFETSVAVAGKVIDQKIRRIMINNAPLKFDLKGDFATTVDLEIGKNKKTVDGWDDANNKIGSARVRILRLKPFPDVEAGYWVRQPISLLAMANIITGYPDGTFKPEGNITRAEMCTLLMKSETRNTKLETNTKFKDVPANHWAAKYIAGAAGMKVVLGYPDGTFRPKSNITRAEGLAMIVRFTGISQEAYLGQFPDIPTAHWAAPIISGAFKAGVLQFLENRSFEPQRLLTRAETVEMLQRTRYIQSILEKDLLNWESY